MEDERKLREFNEQMESNKFVTNPNPNVQEELYSNVNPEVLPNSPSDNALLERAGMMTTNPPSEIGTTFARCNQCGTFHPPVKSGEKCPVAPIKQDGKDLDLNHFFAQLKNILTSQIDQKNIKDVPGLMKKLIINVTEFLEEYNE